MMARTPKILMLAPEWRWPPTTGGEVRAVRLAESLAKRMEVDVVGPTLPGMQPPPVFANAYLQPRKAFDVLRRIMSMLCLRNPYHVNLYYDSNTAKQVAVLLARNKYDVIYSNFIYPLIYVSSVRHLVIVDQHNVDRQYWLNKADQAKYPFNLIASWNLRRTISFELRHLPCLLGYVSVSGEDRNETMKYSSPYVPNFWVAPNGVNTEKFVPGNVGNNNPRQIVLGYLGSMDLEMNVTAVKHFITAILPCVRSLLSGNEVLFDIIGRDPTFSLCKLAGQTEGVRLTGRVVDVVPYLQRLDVMVCPIRMGAGTKLKVVESMSCGIPVVGSRLALAGLPGRSGKHYIIADSEPEFINAVCQLALSVDMRRKMGMAARELIRSFFDWSQIGNHLADEICSTLEER